jgi:hypothetical protein
MPNFDTIKQELQRLYDICSPTSFRALLMYSKNYFNFVKNTPLLKSIIENEQKNYQEKIKDREYRNNFDFMCWPIYRDHPQIIDKELQQIEFPLPLTAFKKILNILDLNSGKLSYKERFFRNTLKIFHDQILRRVISEELGISKTPQPTEAMTRLGLTQYDKWEDIEIVLMDEFNVRVRYKEDREYITDVQKMGFADERIKDKMHAKDSWKFLHTLAANNGNIVLGRITEKQKKDKQDLTKTLKLYFQIPGDPFYETDKETSTYRIKLKLVPDPDFRLDISEFRNRDFLKPITSL